MSKLSIEIVKTYGRNNEEIAGFLAVSRIWTIIPGAACSHTWSLVGCLLGFAKRPRRYELNIYFKSCLRRLLLQNVEVVIWTSKHYLSCLLELNVFTLRLSVIFGSGENT